MLFANGVHRVLLRDVRDLVAEHARKLRFRLDERERAAGDVDVSARRRKRVDAIGVEHHERPRQLRPGRLLRQDGADQRDVLMDRGVLHDAEPLAHFQADVTPRA